jgi:molecular chaperone IbpA
LLKEDIAMRTFDFSPLFRSTVGFDRMTQLLDAAMQGADHANGYPPYNIEKQGDDNYRITLAVAGFGVDDVEITAHENRLVVSAKSRADDDDEKRFLHRGIAGRAFERTFQLADHIRVKAADMENGLLHIELEREVPEELKPRRIEIAGAGPKAIDRKAA